MTMRLYGYLALYLAIRIEKATVNNAVFAVGLSENGYRNSYRRRKEKAAGDGNR